MGGRTRSTRQAAQAANRKRAAAEEENPEEQEEEEEEVTTAKRSPTKRGRKAASSSSATSSRGKRGAAKAGAAERDEAAKRAKQEEESEQPSIKEEELEKRTKEEGKASEVKEEAKAEQEKKEEKEEAKEPEMKEEKKEAKETEMKEEAQATESKATQTEEKDPILEKGNIYFFYRPKVNLEVAASMEDVKVLYLFLVPAFGSKGPKRLLRVSKKRLPETSAGKRKSVYFAFVSIATENMKEMDDYLGEHVYQTKTRGERREAPVQPLAEGVYGLVEHNDHTHLVYFLELPTEPGPVQEAFRIDTQGSLILQVKNPANPEKKIDIPSQYENFQGLGDKWKADYPSEMDEKFHTNRFTSKDIPTFLNYKGSQFLLIGASDDPLKELGVPAQEIEELVFKPEETEASEEDLDKQVLERIKLNKPDHLKVPEQMTQGEWGTPS